jgi:hypothetical protein
VTEGVVLICKPVSAGPAGIPGAVTMRCGLCPAEIWVAPSGVEIVARTGAKPVCWTCALELEPPESVESISPTQVEELRRALGARRAEGC